MSDTRLPRPLRKALAPALFTYYKRGEPMFPPMRKTVDVGTEPLKNNSQEANNVGAGFKIRPQPLGKELDKEAQVWEIYVQETDRFDTELVKEWNDSLDVLLIFAALFSAITTALVLESAKQLQPDPANASAQTLLAISQTLVAISNGQKVDTSTAPSSPPSTFVPSQTSIFVNALWFLSLGLSVAVSLVAMLSKSWCHAFMAKRSGPKYEQGQRRQRKWSGIERWGMESVFMYLPTLMHLALLLFAIGLAVYLWGINVKVASPVVALAVVSVLLYATATVLPSIYGDCPYSTPLSKPLKRTSAMLPGLIDRIPWDRLQAKYQDLFERARQSALLAHLEQWRNILRNPAEQHQSIEDELPIKREADDTPMDEVTSRMLCWLVEHCEDKRLVDVALHSIAGACCGLPRAPFVESDVVGIIAQRIKGCFDYGGVEGILKLKRSASVGSVVSYTRALSWLLTNDMTHGLPFDCWSAASKHTYALYSKLEPNQSLAKFFGFFQASYLQANIAHDTDPEIAAVLASIVTPTSHYVSETPKSIYTVPGTPSLEKRLSHVVLHCIQVAAGRETRAHAYESKSRQLLRSFPNDAILSSIEGEDFELGLKLLCDVPHTQLRRTCLKVLNLSINASDLDQDKRDYYIFKFTELAEPTLMGRLLHLSFGTEDVYIAPYVMRYLWGMTERLMWEAEQQPEGEPATILAQVLQTEAFLSLKQKVPNLPATPRNVFETGLADVWYPLVAEMSGHRSTAQVVFESGILGWMEYTSEEHVKDTSPHATELQQDGRKWLEIIQELISKRDSAINATE